MIDRLSRLESLEKHDQERPRYSSLLQREGLSLNRLGRLAGLLLLMLLTLGSTCNSEDVGLSVIPYNEQSGNSWAIQLQPTDSHVCALTKVRGNFSGTGEFIRLHHEFGKWVLRGGSKQSEVAGRAHCFRRAGFKVVQGSEPDISDEFVVTDSPPGPSGVAETVFGGGDCIIQSKKASAWDGASATMLSGMSGEFSGGEERVIVDQSKDPNKSSLISVGSCQGSIQARAHSFRIGVPGDDVTEGTPARFWNDKQYTASTQGDSNVVMAPIAEGMCYFTEISGDFDGGAEWAEIDIEAARWHLRVAHGGGGLVKASARCLLRDQGASGD